jgi:hypothetical protein
MVEKKSDTRRAEKGAKAALYSVIDKQARY